MKRGLIILYLFLILILLLLSISIITSNACYIKESETAFTSVPFVNNAQNSELFVFSNMVQPEIELSLLLDPVPFNTIHINSMAFYYNELNITTRRSAYPLKYPLQSYVVFYNSNYNDNYIESLFVLSLFLNNDNWIITT